MKTRSILHRPVFAFAFALAFVISHSSFVVAQGSLTPPGAPAPTMKTLDQLEPRTPISSLPVTVGSGSYYLTGNLTGGSAQNGITVSQNAVTIDLNGFELVGVAGSAAGIFINGNVSNVTIRNGTIRNWGGRSIDGSGNLHVRVENVRVISNGGDGIVVGMSGEVMNCLVQSCTLNGIVTADNCLIENCQVISTTGSPGIGIATNDSCRVSKCVARSNAGIGINPGANANISGCTMQANGGAGISTGNNASISNCTAQSNAGFGIKVTDNCTIADCTALSTTGAGAQGIATGDTCTVSGCSARLNAGDNIRVSSNSTVVKCSTSGSAGGNGINAPGGSCLISQCTANSNNQHGINAFQRTRISDCTANGNSQSGIHNTTVGTVERCFCNGNTVCGILMDAGGFMDILNNNCSENGPATSGAGIRVSVGGGCRVEGNNLVQNFRGLDILSTRNDIVKNVAVNNSNADYSIVAGSSVGPIINVAGVGDISGTAGANHPFANFRY